MLPLIDQILAASSVSASFGHLTTMEADLSTYSYCAMFVCIGNTYFAGKDSLGASILRRNYPGVDGNRQSGKEFSISRNLKGLKTITSEGLPTNNKLTFRPKSK